MNDLATTLGQFAKIAATHPESISSMATQFAKIAATHPESISSLLDAISDGQLLSKQWIIDELAELKLGTIFICGGWYASLLLHNLLSYTRCISFDADPTCKPVADILHRKLIIDKWKFVSVTKNIHNIDYNSEEIFITRADKSVTSIVAIPDTIINTSCEHIENFNDWWDMLPEGKLIILQSNNGYGIPGHINCSDSLDSFAKLTPMQSILFSGELMLPKFTRYMRIGYK